MTANSATLRMPWWAWAWPVLAIVSLAAGFSTSAHGLIVVMALALVAATFSAVYHAEVVAHRVGEPFGTLVLAVAVTVIEVSLVVSVMLGGAAEHATLARDTVFAAVMLACNGIVGLCLLAGGVRHFEQGFQVQGASAALAVLAALTTLALVLPNFTISTPGPVFNDLQLDFAALVSLVLYGAFVFIQTVRHRDYFLSSEGGNEETHASPPTAAAALASFGLLIVSLVCVVGLAKALSPSLEAGITWLGVPRAAVGVVIAALVLLPEALAALRAARANRLQTSLNLALGSALATIGLTIPAVSVLAVLLGLPLTLGLDAKEEVLLALTLLVGVMTLGTGRTTVLQGAVHLAIVAAFLFLTVVP